MRVFIKLIQTLLHISYSKLFLISITSNYLFEDLNQQFFTLQTTTIYSSFFFFKYNFITMRYELKF